MWQTITTKQSAKKHFTWNTKSSQVVLIHLADWVIFSLTVWTIQYFWKLKGCRITTILHHYGAEAKPPGPSKNRVEEKVRNYFIYFKDYVARRYLPNRRPSGLYGRLTHYCCLIVQLFSNWYFLRCGFTLFSHQTLTQFENNKYWIASTYLNGKFYNCLQGCWFQTNDSFRRLKIKCRCFVIKNIARAHILIRG